MLEEQSMAWSRRSVLAAAAGSCVVACTSRATGERFHVGFNGWIGYSALYIANKEGLLARAGIGIELTDTEKLSDRIAALAGGGYDLVGATVDSSVVSAAANIPGKIIFAFDDSNGADGIVADGGIASIPELKGRTVAVEEAFTDHFMLLKVLADHGLEPGDVTIRNLSAPDGATAFQAGKVDAAAIFEPYLSQAAAKRPGSKVLYTTKQDSPLLFDILYAPDRVIAGHRPALVKLLSALAIANDHWAADPRKYASYVASIWNWKEDEVLATMAQITLATSRIQQDWFLSPGRPIQSAADFAARLWLKAGVIKEPIDARALVDGSLIRDALTALPHG